MGGLLPLFVTDFLNRKRALGLLVVARQCARPHTGPVGTHRDSVVLVGMLGRRRVQGQRVKGIHV